MYGLFSVTFGRFAGFGESRTAAGRFDLCGITIIGSVVSNVISAGRIGNVVAVPVVDMSGGE